MKIVTLDCKNCGGHLQVNSMLKQGVCNFCGTPFILDDEVKRVKIDFEDAVQVGYDFERGRMNAQNDGADPELIRTVQALIEPVCGMEELQNRVDMLRAQFEKDKRTEDFLKSDLGKYLPASIGAALVVLCAIISATSGGGIGSFLGGIIFAGVIFAGVFFGQKLYLQSLIKKNEDAICQIENDVQEIDYFSDVLRTYDVNIIPMKYRNRDAMTYIYQMLDSRQAVTIQQAVTLYEEELRRRAEEERRERELALQEEQLELQRQQMEEMRYAEEERREQETNKKIAGAVATGALAVGGAAVVGAMSNKKVRKAAGKMAGKVAGSVVKGIIGRL